jgi:PHD/YefM family antitoxin component YafN of YafNO toxin-antitoxin module
MRCQGMPQHLRTKETRSIELDAVHPPPQVDFRTHSEYHSGMTTTALHTTRRSSDLSKRSAEVFAEAEDHPVTVTRRDGEALVLMSQREAESRNRMLQFAAQLIGVAVDDSGPLGERMSRAFPWMLALSPEDRAICAQNLVDAARASFSTDQPHLVLAELTSWKETATAIAAGLGQGEQEWLDDDVVVKRP